MTAFGYAVIGLLLGIYMAGSKNHGQLVTHANIMLLGFVASFIYGVCYKLWLSNTSGKLVGLQYYYHQVGAAALIISLFLMYGGFASERVLGPILGISSLLFFAGLVLIKVMFIKNKGVV